MSNTAWEYIKSDLYRYAGPITPRIFLRHLKSNRSFRFSVWLRLSSKADNSIVRCIARRFIARMSKKYGLQIPPSAEIGYGLYIGHGLCVVMHPKTVIGDNCNLSRFTTIGSNRDTPARIGNNVYIGPNVCIVEDVAIGDNVVIGAGAVVVKNAPANCTIAGNPARIISQNRRDPEAPNLWKHKAI